MKEGAGFSLPPLSKLPCEPTWIGRGPQGPFGKLIRKVVTDALAIKKKRGRSYHRTLKKKQQQPPNSFIAVRSFSFFFQWARCKAGEVWGNI